MKKILFITACTAILALPAQAQSVFSYSLPEGGGYLGVTIREVGPDDLAQFQLQKEAGVIIESVMEDTPAAEADLQPDDVILRFDGEAVRSVRQFQRLVSDTPTDRAVTLSIWRDGSSLDKRVTMGSRKLSQTLWHGQRGAEVTPFALPDLRVEVPEGSNNVFFVTRRPLLGIRGQAITEQLAQTLGVTQKAGVLVMEVMEKTPAEKAGIQAGDVIIGCDGQKVEEISDISSHMKPGEHEVNLVRDKKPITLKVEIEDKEKPIRPQGKATKL